jgi:putative transposase
MRGFRRLIFAANTGSVMRLRDECLNEHLFSSYVQAQHVIETWRNDYNQNRPHTSLKGHTPIEFANRSNMDQNLNRANL